MARSYTFQPIKTAPRDEMFIWGYRQDSGRWSIGLAYWTVSGNWRDAYGHNEPPERATHWAPLPEPDVPFIDVDRLITSAKLCHNEMRHTVAPRDSFTDALDALDAALYPETKKAADRA